MIKRKEKKGHNATTRISYLQDPNYNSSKITILLLLFLLTSNPPPLKKRKKNQIQKNTKDIQIVAERQ